MTDENHIRCQLVEQLRHNKTELENFKRKNAALLEQIGLRLAACDCAATSDTAETHAQNKTVTRDNPSWSPAFESVMRHTAECIKLRAEKAALQKDVNDLNNLLRAAGWGQGEIDSAACVEEENDKLRAENAALRAALKRLGETVVRWVPDVYSQPVVDEAAEKCDATIRAALAAHGVDKENPA